MASILQPIFYLCQTRIASNHTGKCNIPWFLQQCVTTALLGIQTASKVSRISFPYFKTFPPESVRPLALYKASCMWIMMKAISSCIYWPQSLLLIFFFYWVSLWQRFQLSDETQLIIKYPKGILLCKTTIVGKILMSESLMDWSINSGHQKNTLCITLTQP